MVAAVTALVVEVVEGMAVVEGMGVVEVVAASWSIWDVL
jgi:hypothetical protein